MKQCKRVPDGRPTMADWPIQIEAESELPQFFRAQVLALAGGSLSGWQLVYAPQRPARGSFAYLFGYGGEQAFYLRLEPDETVTSLSFSRSAVHRIECSRELLSAAMTIFWQEGGHAGDNSRQLELCYVPSVYYLYDPFLNWLLHLPLDFVPALAEKASPRPQPLFAESLVMYNYLLDGYRLGCPVGDYVYHRQTHRSVWMPWKTVLEESLTIPMERGSFSLYNYGYLSRRCYLPQ